MIGKRMQDADLPLVVPIGVTEKHIITQRLGNIKNAASDFREKWICDIAEDQPNRVGVLGDERTCELAGSIAEFVDGSRDPLPRGLGDLPLVVNHARDGFDGDTRIQSHISQRHCHRHTPRTNPDRSYERNQEDEGTLSQH